MYLNIPDKDLFNFFFFGSAEKVELICFGVELMPDQYLVPPRSVGGTKPIKGFNTMKEQKGCHEMLRCS